MHRSDLFSMGWFVRWFGESFRRCVGRKAERLLSWCIVDVLSARSQVPVTWLTDWWCFHQFVATTYSTSVTLVFFFFFFPCFHINARLAGIWAVRSVPLRVYVVNIYFAFLRRETATPGHILLLSYCFFLAPCFFCCCCFFFCHPFLQPPSEWLTAYISAVFFQKATYYYSVIRRESRDLGHLK